MGVIMLVLVVLAYIFILLGLTIWFEKYHYYKSMYFDKPQPKKDELHSGSNSSKQKSPSMTNKP